MQQDARNLHQVHLSRLLTFKLPGFTQPDWNSIGGSREFPRHAYAAVCKTFETHITQAPKVLHSTDMAAPASCPSIPWNDHQPVFLAKTLALPHGICQALPLWRNFRYNAIGIAALGTYLSLTV